MFLSAIALALVVGALAGGGLPRLANLRLRWIWLLGAALALRLAAQITARGGVQDLPFEWAFMAAYALVLLWLWGNWSIPGLQIAAVGIFANSLAVFLNGGQMPIWPGAFFAAGFTLDDIAGDPFHFLLQADSAAQFVANGGLLGDVIPIPLPVIRDVVSIGDVLLAIGIFWTIVYSMTRPEAPSRASVALGMTGNATAATQPFQSGVGVAGGAVIPAEMSSQTATEQGVRLQSPYLRLVRNRDFSMLWTGQLVSLFGERIHTVALGFAVLIQTGSAMDVGFTFAAGALPSVVLGPLAGTLVDRWDRRITMIACDLARAALVVAVPLVIEVDVILVYVMAFLIATVTLLFRPAKTAVIPAIVDRRDLVTANSASSAADFAADLLGFPLAGVIVATLGATGSMELAFFLGGVTYVVSAVFIWGMRVPSETVEHPPISVRAVWSEMVEGWNFLRQRADLFSNTIVSAVAQLAVGAEIAASLPYATRVLDSSRIPSAQIYALLLTAVAVGSVLGGLVVGAFGERLPKGPVIIAGFIGMGLSLVAAGLVTDPFLAIGIFFFTGAANMLFIIPTITLFQERTPQRLMGRVVSSRQALVYGSIAISMGVSGWLSEVIGAGMVFIVSGAICALAGAAAIFVPAMRNVR